jgi:hypothetical protein
MKPILQTFSKFWFLLAFGLYSFVFILPLPPQIISKGIHVTDEIIVLATCAIIFYTQKKTSWLWETLSLTLTLVIFTLPLLRLWASAESNYNLVLGLLPWSDASGYYSDATRLLQGDLFKDFSGHRPLFASFLAVLLKISNGNIQVSILVLTIIIALSVFLLAREIRDSFGPLAGAGIILLLQMYYRPYTGTLLTEQLGMPLGLIALSNLLYATRHKNKWCFSGGLFILTFALYARAGAFFVLPAILIAGIFIFKEDDRFSAKVGSLFIVTLLAAWGANVVLVRMIAAPDTMSLGNFSYTIYGQAVGGKGWTQVFIDHPEIGLMDDTERSQTAYRLALDEILKDPSKLATGFFNAWKDFFVPSMFACFGFVQPGDKYSGLIIQIILTVFLIVGAVLCFKRRQCDVYLLLLAITCGIFLSIPFIPPSESASMRVYAATISIPSLLAWIGISAVLPTTINFHQLSTDKHPQQILALSALGFGLVFLSTGGALIVKAMSQAPLRETVVCPAGLIPIQLELSHGAYVQIVTNESGLHTLVPTISAKDFRKSLREFPGVYHNLSDTFIQTITPPVLLTYTRNMLTNEFVWLITPPELANSIGKTLHACGETVGQDFSMFYVKKLVNFK